VLADYTRRESDPHISFSSLRITYFPPLEEALAQLDYDNRIKPAIYYDEQMRFREFPFTKTPMLPTDTTWVHLDTVELAAADLHIHKADSLNTLSRKVGKELQALEKRSEEWRRKNSSKIDSLNHQVALLDSLRQGHIECAEQLESNIFGQPRKRKESNE
jgi:hypothetical protein